MTQFLDHPYYARGGTVHHIDDECPQGRKIDPEDLVKNEDGGLPLCPVCKGIGDAMVERFTRRYT